MPWCLCTKMYNMYSNIKCKLCEAELRLTHSCHRLKTRHRPKASVCVQQLVQKQINVYISVLERSNLIFNLSSARTTCSWLEKNTVLFSWISSTASLPEAEMSLWDSAATFWWSRDSARGPKLGKIQTKFIFYTGKRGCSKSVSTDVFRVGRRKIWNSSFRWGFWSRRFAVWRKKMKKAFPLFKNSRVGVIHTLLNRQLRQIRS